MSTFIQIVKTYSTYFYISDRMAENMKKELEQWEFKEEIVSIQEPVGDTCTVHKQEDDAQMEYTEIKGKHQFKKQLSGSMF